MGLQKQEQPNSRSLCRSKNTQMECTATSSPRAVMPLIRWAPERDPVVLFNCGKPTSSLASMMLLGFIKYESAKLFFGFCSAD